MSYYDDRREFALKFDLPTDSGPPTLLPDSMFLARYQHLQEELQEMLAAHRAGDLCEFADAVVDLVYVALGVAMFARLPFDALWAEVQAANMRRVRADDPNAPAGHRGDAQDVLKPAGWVPPDILRVLSDAGMGLDEKYDSRFLRPPSPIYPTGSVELTGDWKPMHPGISVEEAGKAIGAVCRLMKRTPITTWDNRFIALAVHVAAWSKDPSTGVGCVIVGPDRRDITIGYNGFPPGIADTPERLADRAARLARTQHAERNALDNARFDVRGATLYTTFFVCSACAKSVISKGIARVVSPSPVDREPWVTDSPLTREMFDEAGVDLTEIEFPE